jgi:hypothetical protein
MSSMTLNFEQLEPGFYSEPGELSYQAAVLLPINDFVLEILHNCEVDVDYLGFGPIDVMYTMLFNIGTWEDMSAMDLIETAEEHYLSIHATPPPHSFIQESYAKAREWYDIIAMSYPNLKEWLVDSQPMEFEYVLDWEILPNGLDDSLLLTLAYKDQ